MEESKRQISSEMSAAQHQAPVPSLHLVTNGQLRSAGDLGLKCFQDNPVKTEAGGTRDGVGGGGGGGRGGGAGYETNQVAPAGSPVLHLVIRFTGAGTASHHFISPRYWKQ